MDSEPTELSDVEKSALHDLQLGTEHIYRAYGRLLEFHHETGRAMDKFEDAREKLTEAGHDEFAEQLQNDILPAGTIDELWTYEIVETVHDEFIQEATEFESSVRDALAGGQRHITEQEQQQRWRQRANREE